VSQYLIDNVLILNARNDPDGTTAATANLNVDIENSLESLGPGHSGMALSRRTNFRIGKMLHTFASFSWCDQSPPSMAGR